MFKTDKNCSCLNLFRQTSNIPLFKAFCFDFSRDFLASYNLYYQRIKLSNIALF